MTINVHRWRRVHSDFNEAYRDQMQNKDILYSSQD
jgi:hypothetical protein